MCEKYRAYLFRAVKMVTEANLIIILCFCPSSLNPSR